VDGSGVHLKGHYLQVVLDLPLRRVEKANHSKISRTIISDVNGKAFENKNDNRCGIASN